MRTITIGMKIKALGRDILLMVILKNVQYNVINEFRHKPWNSTGF